MLATQKWYLYIITVFIVARSVGAVESNRIFVEKKAFKFMLNSLEVLPCPIYLSKLKWNYIEPQINTSQV